MNQVLIIDDDLQVCSMLKETVSQLGHHAIYVHSCESGLETARKTNFDLIFLDVYLPDGTGLDILPDLKKTASQPEVIIITGEGDHNSARMAIESGAWDYIQKGGNTIEQMNLSFARAIEYRKQKTSTRPIVLKRDNIVGDSPLIRECLDCVARAAFSDANTLITGATGTGKELFARTIHENSRRASKGIVVVDCTVLPDTLVESILFGHEKGAFTGADKYRDGLIKQADGGTLFLDEIGDLPLSIQKSFLRVLQERCFRPVGSKNEVSSDFRIISATRRNLEEMVQKNTFREDLLYRLRALTIHLPTLSERREDIRPLTQKYLYQLFEKSDIAPQSISSGFYEALEAYSWPGNVRELFHALESAFSAAFGGTLIPQHLPREIRIHATQVALNETCSKHVPLGPLIPLPTFKEFRHRMTATYLLELTKRTQGDIQTACCLSGLSRSRLYALLKEHDVL